jgi:hypothetical protein
MEPRVGMSGAHVFPLVASSVTLQILIGSSERNPYQKPKQKPHNKLKLYKRYPYNCAGVASVRANLAVLIFSLKKKEACFFISWKEGVPMLVLLFLFKIDMSEMKKIREKQQFPD